MNPEPIQGALSQLVVEIRTADWRTLASTRAQFGGQAGWDVEVAASDVGVGAV